jgi:hypothetical protein
MARSLSFLHSSVEEPVERSPGEETAMGYDEATHVTSLALQKVAKYNSTSHGEGRQWYSFIHWIFR